MKLLVKLLSVVIIFPIAINGQDYHLNFPDTMFLKWDIQSHLDLVNDEGDVYKRISKLNNKYILHEIRNSKIIGKSIFQIEKGHIIKWEYYDNTQAFFDDSERSESKFSEFPSISIIYRYKNSKISSIMEIEGLDKNEVLRTSIFEYSEGGKLRQIKSKNKIYQVSVGPSKNNRYGYSKTLLRTVEYYSEIEYSTNEQIERIYQDKDLIRIKKTLINGNVTIYQEYNKGTQLLSELTQIKDRLDRVISEEYKVTDMIRNQDTNFILPYSFKYIFKENRLIYIDTNYSIEDSSRSKAMYIN